MEIKLKKQPQKYLAGVDEKTRKKLYKALDQISRLEGNIVRLGGYKARYRYKIDHYRIVFDWVQGEIVIVVVEINTRTNIKY